MKLISLDHLLATALVFSVMLFLPAYFNLDFLDPVSQTLQDFYMTDVVFSRLRDNNAVSKDTNIVLVNYGYLNRKAIAAELEIINRYQPRVVAFDSFFRNPKKGDQDSMLSAAMSRVNNLVLPSQLSGYDQNKGAFDSLLTSYSLFNQYAKTGFANIINEEEYFRTVRTFSKSEFYSNGSSKKAELAFPVKIAQLYDPGAVNRLLKRSYEKEIINYRRNKDKYRVLDVPDVFVKQNDLGFLKDKIVIIGFLGPDINTLVTEDNFFTPMNADYLGKTYPDMYGMVIHANIISMILNNDYLGSTPDWLSVVLVVLITYFNMTFFSYIRHRAERWYEPVSILLTLSEVVALLLVIIFCFHWLGFDVDVRAGFFAIMMSIPAYETYMDSLKPIFIDYYNKLVLRLKPIISYK